MCLPTFNDANDTGRCTEIKFVLIIVFEIMGLLFSIFPITIKNPKRLKNIPEATYSNKFVNFHSFIITLSPATLIPGIIQLAISQQQLCYYNQINTI